MLNIHVKCVHACLSDTVIDYECYLCDIYIYIFFNYNATHKLLMNDLYTCQFLIITRLYPLYAYLIYYLIIFPP